MKVVFHQRFREYYDNDPAAAPGRLDGAIDILTRYYEFVEPSPAAREDILLCHTPALVQRVSKKARVYKMALLAAGGAIKAAQIAVEGEPAFALVRPPGHHAGRDYCRGFCWFNNIAVAVEKMRRLKGIRRVLVVDIDRHLGDGTRNIFLGNPWVKYYHLGIPDDLEKHLAGIQQSDLVAVSAGFDGHVEDWGGLFLTEDYYQIGGMIGSFAHRLCAGRVFASLEGGYNYGVLGQNILAFLTGLEGL